jgi:hypothetical protein
MDITFKNFQLKADSVDVYPESSAQMREYALTGLLSETGKLSKALGGEPPDGDISREGREKVIENTWKTLWFLAAACRSAGISLEEVAESGMTGLDKIGNEFLPKQ